MEFKGTKGKWKHKKGKRTKFEYDNFILDKYGNHILKWSNTGNGSHKLTIKESHANGLLISKAHEMLEMLERAKVELSRIKCSMMAHPDCTEGSEFDDYTSSAQDVENNIEQLIKEATEL